MSEIVGFVGISHSPFATMLAAPKPGEPGALFLADADRVAKAVAKLAPDAVVVIGPDHFHANFYDVMPSFVVGVESATGYGDFGSASGPLPVHSALAWDVHKGLGESGFDPALSYSLTADHGIVQGYEMATGGTRIPMVPVVLNTAAPPLPSLTRCRDFGLALGETLRASTFDGRVLIIASGGLSHWLPSNDPRDPAVTAGKRAALINGRLDVATFTAEREPRVRAMGGNPATKVNRAWDTWFLDALCENDLSLVVELGSDGLEELAGTGGHEIRCWLAGHAATGKPLRWTSYEAVPEWITGMGIGTTFDIPS
ncbi:2,3-dihydroxyphenylpropionate 1,2-dioxygenase [Amycolatopsis sp. cg5]|uniref:DODA-type extradiol aromatic ring-opening family dioxygenase n=1 Tax=Amycolatopsis sp. cg5 TaxID=3238802 RepID=UPI003523E472